MLYAHNLFLSLFLQFQMCFLHMVVVFGNRCDNKNHVELVDPNDHSKFECWPVPTCQEGQEPSVKPGSVHPKATDVSCIPCGHGWFSNHDTNFRCQKCTSCGNKDVRVNCSIYRDAVYSKSCKSNTLGRIGLISPTQVANHNTVMIRFILPTCGFSHLINQLLTGFLGHSLP